MPLFPEWDNHLLVIPFWYKIGKAHRLNLSAKIKHRTSRLSQKNYINRSEKNNGRGRKRKFRSLIIDKNFEPAKNLSLEELNENTCKYGESDPDKPDFSFCGRKTVEKFSYCPLHLMIIFQDPRKKKDENIDKEDEVPQFIEKKIKSA